MAQSVSNYNTESSGKKGLGLQYYKRQYIYSTDEKCYLEVAVHTLFHHQRVSIQNTFYKTEDSSIDMVLGPLLDDLEVRNNQLEQTD